MNKELKEMNIGSLTWRFDVGPEDAAAAASLCGSSGFFSEAEIKVAAELVSERLTKGDESGYFFIFAQSEDRVLGYACYGPIPCTRESWDLYWIVVDNALRFLGLGGRLLTLAEQSIIGAGGRRFYIETSSKEQYRPTRDFYLKHGYIEQATLHDFYAPGDHKIIYCKKLTSDS